MFPKDSFAREPAQVNVICASNRTFSRLQRPQLQSEQRSGQGYFLKQVRQWEPENVRTLQTEAQCYRLAAQDSLFADLAGIVPRFCFFDPRRSVLATELVDGAETIAEHHFRNDAFPVEVAEQLGQAFGRYHRKAAAGPPPNLDGLLLRRPAWALSLHDMPFQAPALSGGIHQMLGMVRQFPQFAAALEGLRSGWRADAVIHGDIKWDNCMLCPGSNGHLSLKIVDWEMADWGDSCWDVAGILSSYLSFWVQSLPGNNMADPGAMVAEARYPVERMQPAMQSFWRTYARCRELSGEDARGLLRRTMLYTGARIIQTAFEMLQASQTANSGTVLLLQFSMNVLGNPEEAVREILGIEP